MAALRKANVVRIERGRLTRALKHREAGLAELLVHEHIAGMPLGRLLEYLPGHRRIYTKGTLGHHASRSVVHATRIRKDAGKALGRGEIGWGRRVGDLSDRERQAILAATELVLPGGCP